MTLSTALAGQSPALRLRMQAVHDPMMNNEEAFRMLVPQDWRVEGGIVWRPEISTMAYLQLRLSDPSGSRALDFFPTLPFAWSQQGFFGFPPGSLYLGSYVVAPLDPDNFVRLVLPQIRGQFSPTVIRTDLLPELAAAIAPTEQEAGAIKQVAAGRARIEYREGTRTFEEDIYSVLVYSQVPMYPGVMFWGPDRLFGFRAEKGQLDRQVPLLQTIFASVRVNRGWFGRVLQVREAWIQNQMQAIRSAAELSRYIARTADEISDMQQQVYENRRASEDRTAAAYSQYVRGVETYHDPFGNQEVQLPTGYNDVWVSRAGEYILANDPSFNPNVSASGTWQRVDPSHN
jgi:rubrerythrin